MNKFRLILIFFSIALIGVILFFIDYQNFISRSNLGSFLGIVAMVFNIIAMILSNRYETKKEVTTKMKGKFKSKKSSGLGALSGLSKKQSME